MAYHEVTEQVKKMLDDNDCEYAVFEHEPVRTSEEAAEVRPNYTIEQGAKALIIRAKKGESSWFVMLALPGDARFDPGMVRSLLGVSNIRFAREEEVKEITGGVEPGGVPPMGNLFGLTTYADEGLLVEYDEIVFNAGDKRVSIAMLVEDYERIVQPKHAQIAE